MRKITADIIRFVCLFLGRIHKRVGYALEWAENLADTIRPWQPTNRHTQEPLNLVSAEAVLKEFYSKQSIDSLLYKRR